jgi:hypothetical protein
MMQDWHFYRDVLLERIGDYAKQSPDVVPLECHNAIFRRIDLGHNQLPVNR